MIKVIDYYVKLKTKTKTDLEFVWSIIWDLTNELPINCKWVFGCRWNGVRLQMSGSKKHNIL